jgi:regulator of protease activity HflC (stomatin/prohibitin superfamily)
VKTLLATAEKESLRIRGQADAEAARTYWEGYEETLPGGSKVHVDGFGEDVEFFKFYRSLQALKNSMSYEDRLILSTDNPLFEILNLESQKVKKP